MKSLLSLIAVLALAATLSAAAIDGKWKFEREMPEGQGRRGRGSITTTLELKSDGETLTGKVTTKAMRRSFKSDVSEGRIEGDKFSFTTTQQTRQGEIRVRWEGTVNGNELKGTQTIEGRDRTVEFTAKRQ